MNFSDEDKKRAVNYYAFAIDKLEEAARMFNDENNYEEVIREIVPYNLKLIRGSLRCMETIIAVPLNLEEDTHE